jgi:ATP-dependent Clp protease ATP-binding subunit ClpA
MFDGPTGVVKIEVVKALAYFFFGSEKLRIRIVMAEFSEKERITKIIGVPSAERVSLFN